MADVLEVSFSDGGTSREQYRPMTPEELNDQSDRERVAVEAAEEADRATARKEAALAVVQKKALTDPAFSALLELLNIPKE